MGVGEMPGKEGTKLGVQGSPGEALGHIYYFALESLKGCTLKVEANRK